MLKAKSSLLMRRVTWPVGRGSKNNGIFGIPEATLPIHYTTLVGLRWQLRVVCRWASPLLSIMSGILSKSENGPKICSFGGGLKGRILKMNIETSLRNQSPLKHIIQCKKCGTTLKNVFSRAGQEKDFKNEKITQLNIIFHPFAPPPVGPICTIFGT